MQLLLILTNRYQIIAWIVCKKRIYGNPVFCQADICLNHMTLYKVMPEYWATSLNSCGLPCLLYYVILVSGNIIAILQLYVHAMQAVRQKRYTASIRQHAVYRCGNSQWKLPCISIPFISGLSLNAWGTRMTRVPMCLNPFYFRAFLKWTGTDWPENWL